MGKKDQGPARRKKKGAESGPWYGPTGESYLEGFPGLTYEPMGLTERLIPECQGFYNPGTGVARGPTGTSRDRTLAHEGTHYMHHMYPENSNEQNKRSMDTLRTLLSLSHSTPRQYPKDWYWDSVRERLARSGERHYPDYRQAIGDPIDQRKVDSLAAGEHLRGESMITDPGFTFTMDSQGEPVPIRRAMIASPTQPGEKPHAYMVEEPEQEPYRLPGWHAIEEEVGERMKQFYARSHNHIMEQQKQKKNMDAWRAWDVASRVLPAIAGADINHSFYNNGPGAYSPDYDFKHEQQYRFPLLAKMAEAPREQIRNMYSSVIKMRARYGDEWYSQTPYPAMYKKYDDVYKTAKAKQAAAYPDLTEYQGAQTR